MKKILTLISVTLLLQSSIISVRAQQPLNSIQEVIESGLMTQYPDGQFHPERGVIRAELASILVKTFQLENRNTVTNQNQPIPDVPPSHWAYRDIEIALETGIMKGDLTGRFHPNQPVTRAEGFAIFAQAFGVLMLNDADVNRILTSYQDGYQTPDWARQALATAIFEELVNIGNNNALNPLQPMTREDMAYALSQYLAKQHNPGTIPDVPN
ncbi:S-layer homology domain-containing protein [Laspinema olomoucense]|uniref:S-layer homology domain-containing protein n=1 Tax=Laspinema olomoucense D3b TaxID=2953688 RepID=A0ABT2NAP5_9CYAN|nr:MULTISPECIES: S-layer homology domain-containing protein [unclassified Laspinema]MCT7979777.1 S-layer homology domain-containing protein [Laspinema sp. D3b]MCT7993480.1 S-layer homology domain-containing protein [Laspinema sp. D3c]